jgi:beta-lactamase superfamily II metal-dependent hydrolase
MLAAQGPASKALQVYVIDTEGGKATLYVAPGRQTVLVDSGNPGGRDTDRIMAALSDAGATTIDYMVSTHYHVDHVGGLQELAGRVAIGTFVDHGATVEGPVTALREQVPGFQAAYAALHARAKHLVVKAGDRLPVNGLDWRIVSSAGEVLKTPLPGAGRPNPACAGFRNAIDAATWRDPEDGQSIGSLVTLGQFRMIDLADLLWDKAVAMMCPNDTIGAVDLYLVTGHGADVCSADPLVHTLHPRAAVMYNGTRKGGGATAMQGVWRSPGLEDFWQLHWSYNGGLELNAAGLFIANVDDAATIAGILTAPPRAGGRGAAPAAAVAMPTPAPSAAAPAPAAAAAAAPAAAPAAIAPVPQGRGRGGAAAHTPAYWIKISAQPDGTFTVANSRNGFSKTYAARAK